MPILSLHEAQAFEDGRQALVGLKQSLSLPLESRREVTEQETWDDAVSLEEISQASRTLGALSLNENGTPTSLAVDSKLVFVGLSTSVILLFDHFGVTRGQLETTQEAGQVTSLDSYQNSMLLAGYEDGRVVLWDAANMQRFLDVTGPSGVPVTAIRWYRGGQSCVSIDAVGVANLFKFSKTFLLNTYTADRKLLLDGRTRQGFGPLFATRVVVTDVAAGLALAAASFTLIIRLEPEPTKITYRWELPTFVPEAGMQSGSDSQIPCLAYHPTAFVGQNRSSGPTLVRCHECKIDFARLDQMLDVVTTLDSPYTSSAPIICCEWISDCCISLLDANYQFCMLDSQAFFVVGRCDATRVQLVRWQFPSHPELNTCGNSIRALKWNEDANATIYLLGLGELIKVGIQPWNVRVDRLVKSGQWLEAMTLSLKYFRTVLLPIESGEDFKTAGLMSALRDGSKIADLLLNYLRYNAESLSADVGAVCVEYAVSIHRLDLIFEDVFEMFVEKNHIMELMSVLYPFVLAGKIDQTIPPVVFDSLTQYVSVNANNETLEALFLALKAVPADLDGSIRLCKEKRLLSALCRLYNDGLNDFVGPVEVILSWMEPEPIESSIGWREYGYRLFLYLSYCFLGVEFPRGTSPLSAEKAQLARSSFLEYFFPIAPTKQPLIHKPLFACIDFDASAFLKAVEQSPGFDEEHQVLRWLIIAGQRGNIPLETRRIVFEFVTRHLSHMRRARDDMNVTLETILTPALAEQLFHEVYMTLSTPSTVDLVERFSSSSSWFLQQLAMFGEVEDNDEQKRKRLILIAVLSRITVRAAPSEFSFSDALDAYLNLHDEKAVVDFIREQKDRIGSQKYFSKVVGARAKRLLQLNSTEAAKILFDMQVDVEALVRALEGDAALQYALLKPLVGAAAFGEQVTLYMVEKFVVLLCQREPTNAFDWLSKNEGRYPLDAALEACRSHHVDDAAAYLLERAGRVDEALELVLRKPSMRDDPKRVEASAQAAINLCVSFSQNKGRSEMWLRVLDTFSDIAQDSSTSREMGATVERVISRIVDSMMPYVPLSQVLQKIREMETSSSQFRPAVMSMLESLRREASMFETAAKTLRQDQALVEQRKRAARVKGSRIRASNFVNHKMSFVPVEPGFKTSLDATPPRRVLLSGFDDFEIMEDCWDSLADSDPSRLARNLIRGTPYELQVSTMGVFDKPLEELKDAGL